jgi:hypothetical protein
MSFLKNRYTRPQPHRTIGKLFVICTEGSVTEPQYFNHFKDRWCVNIKVIKKQTASDPNSVIEAIETYIKSKGIDEEDEAWIVIDKDNWPESHIKNITQWKEKDKRHKLAISDPQFEYWRLMHYDIDCSGILTSNDCATKLKSLGFTSKHFDMSKITIEVIKKAINKSRKRLQEKENDPKAKIAYTTVHLLVESLINEIK